MINKYKKIKANYKNLFHVLFYIENYCISILLSNSIVYFWLSQTNTKKEKTKQHKFHEFQLLLIADICAPIISL